MCSNASPIKSYVVFETKNQFKATRRIMNIYNKPNRIDEVLIQRLLLSNEKFVLNIKPFIEYQQEKLNFYFNYYAIITYYNHLTHFVKIGV